MFQTSNKYLSHTCFLTTTSFIIYARCPPLSFGLWALGDGQCRNNSWQVQEHRQRAGALVRERKIISSDAEGDHAARGRAAPGDGASRWKYHEIWHKPARCQAPADNWWPTEDRPDVQAPKVRPCRNRTDTCRIQQWLCEPKTESANGRDGRGCAKSRERGMQDNGPATEICHPKGHPAEVPACWLQLPFIFDTPAPMKVSPPLFNVIA